MQKRWYRLGGADPVPKEGWEAEERKQAWRLPYGGIAFAISDALWYFVGPVLEATIGHRPWVEATTEHPPVTMVWRVTGRRRAQEAVEEIAAALARGEERPTPLSAHWLGYDRGGLRLPNKSG